MFTFSALDNSTFYQGIPVKTINMSDTVLSNQQGNLRLVVMVFLSAGNVTFGNETFRVQSGTMKFNIEVGSAGPSVLNFTQSKNFGHGPLMTCVRQTVADLLTNGVQF